METIPSQCLLNPSEAYSIGGAGGFGMPASSHAGGAVRGGAGSDRTDEGCAGANVQGIANNDV